MSSLKTNRTSEIALAQSFPAAQTICTQGRVATQGKSPPESKAASGHCGEGGGSPQPLLLQIQVRCLRGLKDKVPRGTYLLRVSLLAHLGGCALRGREAERVEASTCPVKHGGHFYDVGLYFHESLSLLFLHLFTSDTLRVLSDLLTEQWTMGAEAIQPSDLVEFSLKEAELASGFGPTHIQSKQALPSKAVLSPGLAFLFELCLLLGAPACRHRVVAWAAFPACDNNLDMVEGKFKCPLLRGCYDQKLDRFQTMEDAIGLDLDHWLGNLYFQVLKLPLCRDAARSPRAQTQLPLEFPVCSLSQAEKDSDVDTVPAPTGREAGRQSYTSVGSTSKRTGPCPADCCLRPSERDQGSCSKEEDLSNDYADDKSGGLGGHSPDVSYLEELDKHRFSVCCSLVSRHGGSRKLFKHVQFALATISWELELASWRSQGFWYIILLVATLWFLRLYLHYLGQWLFLWAMEVPVTKFYFSPHTVELCYPASAISLGQELMVVAAGPLALNTAVLPWVLVRGGCQLLFASHPDVLSKFIVTMALWTVLDPLAVFAVDAVLGRLAPSEDSPTADVAKLYWAFVRMEQSGVLGVMVTVILYGLLLLLSSLILYLYCLRWSTDSWISDVFQRTHSEEAMFFVPYDLEISNQELSYIVKRSEQWRGIHGERRKVAVRDYVCESPSPGIRPSRDLPPADPHPALALGPGAVTSHLCIYNVYPSGYHELYRHFLRLPSGAITEVVGDISGLTFVHRDVVRAIQEHLAEAENVLEGSIGAESRGRRASIEI